MGEKAVRFVGQTLALLIFLLSALASSSAEEFRTPAVSIVRVDWRAALDQLRAEIGAVPAAAAIRNPEKGECTQYLSMHSAACPLQRDDIRVILCCHCLVLLVWTGSEPSARGPT